MGEEFEAGSVQSRVGSKLGLGLGLAIDANISLIIRHQGSLVLSFSGHDTTTRSNYIDHPTSVITPLEQVRRY